MKKNVLKTLAAFLLLLLLVPSSAEAQCSGGTLGGNIIPTGVTQTVNVPNGGTYFTFTAIAGGVYQFSFCAADGGSATWDTQLTIIDDATATYAGGYNDDWCGLQSFVQWNCSTSGVYRVLVSQFYCTTNSNSATLAYMIRPPANDLCTGAVYVGTTSTTAGSTQFATADVQAPCVTTDGTGGGVWYTFTGNGNQEHATLCGSVYDTRIRVYSGSCGTLTCVTGNDDGTCAPQSSVDFCTASGTQYYILVHGNGAAVGAFTLNLTETTVNPPIISPSFGSYCGSGSVTMTASGSTAYNWAPNTALNTTTGPTVIASPSVTTTYTVTITDAGTGCPAVNQATITVYPVPVVTASNSTGPVCSGQNVTLNANGADFYDWQPGFLSGNSVNVNPSSTTTYTVTGTTVNGCINTATVTATINQLPIMTASAASPAICTGTYTTLTATGASTYTWMPGFMNGPVTNAAPTSTTTYTVNGTGANGCSNTATVSVTVNPLPTITATTAVASICRGSSDSITAAGGLSYTWSNNSAANPLVITPNASASYTVTGTDANGCSSTATASVTVLPNPPISVTSSEPSICGGGSTILTATGAPGFNWMPGNLSGSSVTVTPATSTTYTVTGTNTNGCSRTDSISIGVFPAANITATSNTGPFCSGGSATLTATGGNTYNWLPGNIQGSSIVVSPASSLTYTVTGTDVNGCSGTSTVPVTVNVSPTVTATSSTSGVVCAGNSTALNASGASSYVWMPGNLTGNSITVNPTVSTNYTVTGTNVNGCSDTYAIGLTVAPPPNLIVYSSMTEVCLYDAPVYLYSIPAGGNWTGTGVNGTMFSPASAGVGTDIATYTYTDQYGCTNNATTSIIVNACVGIEEASDLNGVSFFPNPNNGTFTVSVTGKEIHGLKIEIVDLQGRLVYAENAEGLSNGSTKEIDLKGVDSGAYYIRFSSETNVHTAPLIIQR